jgi:hypothetical protein
MKNQNKGGDGTCQISMTVIEMWTPVGRRCQSE